MKYTAIHDTISAISTPQGEGAIGIVRLSGPEAIAITERIFFGKILSEQAGHTLHFGSIRKGEKILDEVVVGLFRAPHSYTGEDVVEISCHASPYIMQTLLQLTFEKGARPAKPGEFTLRAFLNGKMDLSQAEAVADLIASGSEAAHELAMKQMRGGFSGEISRLREQLIHFASMIELELDFSEEDVEFANRQELIDLVENIRKLIRSLSESFRLGNVLKNGVATVIAGRPNAGKSTLLNALLKEERAIVSDIPGTTRDTIEELINIEGILFRLIDTAGLRDASDKIEAMGVGRTWEEINRSTLVIYLFDLAATGPEALEKDLKRLPGHIPVILAGNKSDLATAEKKEAIKARWPGALILSSLKGENLESLNRALIGALRAENWQQESTIVSNARHFHALQKADEALQNVLDGIGQQVSGEFLALDIRTALDALGEISGEVSSDDLLGNIFSKFCIGK